MTKVHKTADARGLSCPMPIARSMQAIKKIRVGQVLEILTTDPGSKRDISIGAAATKQEFMSFEERGPGGFRFLVKRMR